MKLRGFSEPKHLFLSFGIGLGFWLLVSTLAAASNESPFFVVFLRPGSLLASVVGYGGHNLQGLFLFFLGNILFYWALAFLLLSWLRIQQARRGHSPASGPADTTTTR